VDIDIDTNEGDDNSIYQLTDDRVGLVVWVPKARLLEIRRSVKALPIDGEVMLGTISCGERVWLTRHESGYGIAIGDPDSKDVWINLSAQEVTQLIEAAPRAD
jgi:hypothetical protein